MQLILDDEVRRRQPPLRELTALGRVTWAVEASLVVSLYSTKKSTYLTGPRQCSKLVHCSDDEARQPAIDRLVHSHDGKVDAAAELTLPLCTRDAQVLGFVRVRKQAKRDRFELRPTPGALLQRNRGRLAVVIDKTEGAQPRGFRVVIAFAPHAVGGWRRALPTGRSR